MQRWLSYGIELDNAVIDAGRPATFGFHLCRGNQLSRWLVAGGYEPIAGPVFGGVHADRLLLEYDDERSGTFDALSLVPDDKVVVLGLVTTKTSRVEPEAEVADRVRQAAARVGAERLARQPAVRIRDLRRRATRSRRRPSAPSSPCWSGSPGMSWAAERDDLELDDLELIVRALVSRRRLRRPPGPPGAPRRWPCDDARAFAEQSAPELSAGHWPQPSAGRRLRGHVVRGVLIRGQCWPEKMCRHSAAAYQTRT